MNCARPRMSEIYKPLPLDLDNNCYITKRKISVKTSNMAVTGGSLLDLERQRSPLIEEILSRDEENDVVSMMVMANEINDERDYPSFCTSSQMGHRNPRIRPTSPPLSPLTHVEFPRHGQMTKSDRGIEITTEMNVNDNATLTLEQVLNNENLWDITGGSNESLRKERNADDVGGEGGHDPVKIARGTGEKPDVATSVATNTATNVTTDPLRQERDDDVNKRDGEAAPSEDGDGTLNEGDEGGEIPKMIPAVRMRMYSQT